MSPVPPRPRNLTGSKRSDRPTSGVSGSERRGVAEEPPAPLPERLPETDPTPPPPPPPVALDEAQPMFFFLFYAC